MYNFSSKWWKKIIFSRPAIHGEGDGPHFWFYINNSDNSKNLYLFLDLIYFKKCQRTLPLPDGNDIIDREYKNNEENDSLAGDDFNPVTN